jgi:hypothetical protein
MIEMDEHPNSMRWWRYLWLHCLAMLRLSSYAVCVMSQGRGLVDYHDYPDDVHGEPAYFVELTCKRCGKQFTM